MPPTGDCVAFMIEGVANLGTWAKVRCNSLNDAMNQSFYGAICERRSVQLPMPSHLKPCPWNSEFWWFRERCFEIPHRLPVEWSLAESICTRESDSHLLDVTEWSDPQTIGFVRHLMAMYGNDRVWMKVSRTIPGYCQYRIWYPLWVFTDYASINYASMQQ